MHKFIPSERFADRLMSIVDAIDNALGLGANSDMRTIIYVIFVLGIAILSGLIVRWIIIYVINRILHVRFPQLCHELSVNHVLQKCGRLIPALILFSLIPFAFDSQHKITHIIIVLTLIYTIIASVFAINSFLNFVWLRYQDRHNEDKRPLRGILDISKGAIWTVAVIFIISVIIDKSPIVLLTGLGAFAAVLMLIFKNSILGLVSGVEMADNDMLRVGDWIEIPDGHVNGIVTDVSLVVVKVRNWDNTMAMVPASTLISTTFYNWRYMQVSGFRQIFMSILVDVNTVRPLSEQELQQIQTALPLLHDFIDIKLKQRQAGNVENVFNKEAGALGTIDTNLGLLRAYIGLYLQQHPYIYTDVLHMVRMLQPTPQGFPLQIFAYVNTPVWPDFEAVQSDIFEHLAAVMPTFDLCIFEEPSGRSIYNIGQADRHNVPYNGTDKVYTPTPKPDTNHKPGYK